MKYVKYFTICWSLCLPLKLYAQTSNAGKVFLDGSLGTEVSGTKVEFNQLNIKFLVSPSIGYFLSERNAIGVGIGHEFLRNPEKNHIQNTVLIEAYYRYYFSINENSNFYGELRTSFRPGFSTEVEGYGESEHYYLEDFIGSSGCISLGYTYLKFSNFGIHFSIGFLEYKSEIGSVRHLSILNSGKIGFQYIFK